MTDRETMKRDRDRLAAQVADLDRQLAAPVLPEGWNPASEPPKTRRTVRYAYDSNGRVLVAPAFFDPMLRVWKPDAASIGSLSVGKIVGTPLGWSESPADWLRPAAEAEAMVKPKELSPQTPRDTTNALLVAFHDAPHKLNGDTFDAIAERITAYDWLIDPATLWEPISEYHLLGHPWLTKFRRNDGTGYFTVAYWDSEIMRWVTADTDLVSDDDAVAVLDTDKLIGGGE